MNEILLGLLLGYYITGWILFYILRVYDYNGNGWAKQSRMERIEIMVLFPLRWIIFWKCLVDMDSLETDL